MINLTPEEEKLIEYTRNPKIEYGRAFLVVYYENGKMIRVEKAEGNIIESLMLRTIDNQGRTNKRN